MNNLLNVSSNPHDRSRKTTGSVMYDVILSLLPAAFVGVYHFGLHALLVILVAVAAAVLTEYIFDQIVHKPNTTRDGSAIVTGLLLALSLPAGVPLYIPLLGSLFAILVAKCFFGGLGKNFMNPALAGRCFLLISFSSIVSDFSLDGVSMATPLADMAAGNPVNLVETFLGFSNGVIGGSILALLIGGIFLWITGGITLEIPLSVLLSFSLFIALFGGHGFDPAYIFAHLVGGGIVMGAIFMATDPVSSPVTSTGQVLYGILIGVLCGLFRVMGSAADSVSYGIIISNMVVPLIDDVSVPVPYGLRKQKEPGEKKGFPIPKPAMVLCAITLIAGIALSGVYELTKDTIEAQQLAANAEAYRSVCPDAEEFVTVDAAQTVLDELDGGTYGTDFGKVSFNEVVAGVDASGNTVGYVLSVTTGDGYDGDITLSVGLSLDGTVNSIEFTEITETAGMGMLCAEPAFKDQFAGVNTDAFILNKAGGSTADNEIDSVSGASTSSGAIVNAVNAALDFYAAYLK